MPKEFQIFQEFPRGLVGTSLIIFWKFGHNFGTKNARKSAKLFKYSYSSLESNKNSSQNNGSWRRFPEDEDVIKT